MPRPSNTDERRQQIVHALMQVMAKKGYDGASVADIAAAAGLTPGLVHYHFKNKLEILLGVLATLTSEHDTRLAAALAPAGDDPVAATAAFIDFHLGLGAHADPAALACWITLSGEALRQAQVRRAFATAITALVDGLSELIRRGVQARRFRCARPEAAASALVAAIQGYFVLAATAREVIPRGSAATSVKSMADGLLRPTRPLGRGAPR
ncbi:MAG TPA: TetR/AcrR family transcriptional regulator [Polyangia bacterium]|jgi:TetR/AcrR family transcriptional repressor of bet genes